MWKHKEMEKLRFPCDKCGYKTSQKCNLIAHKKSIHEGVKYPCDQCDYKATRNGNLLRHIQSKHEGGRFPCDQCDYKATRKDSLSKHLTSKHSGVKFQCGQNRATQKGNLINHETSMVSQDVLTPLETLILRIDNNESIPTDELISIVQQIVKS